MSLLALPAMDRWNSWMNHDKLRGKEGHGAAGQGRLTGQREASNGNGPVVCALRPTE